MSLTTAPAIVETMSPFMLPGMASPELQLQIDSGSRVVRFDKECVLIPESPKQKRSMVVTRAYSLPLWKRRGQSESDIEDSAHPERTPSPEEARVVIKLPIPTFRRRSSRSPSRGRSVSTSPMVPNRLTPCLVHRDFSTSPIIPGRVPCSPTRPSLPIYQRRKDDVTVPLRECCHACERITEECLEKGEHWQEKFSKGARRRRSVSLDQYNSLATATLSTLHIRSSRCGKVCSTESSESVGDHLGLELDLERRPCKFSITVDEVDKRRKSLDLSINHNNIQCDEAEPPSPGSSYTTIFQSHLRDASHSSASSTNTTTTTDELVPDILDSKHRLRSSPIEEEDEAELFPLPRRTPSGTPSPRVSPAPSPHGSTSCLPSSVPGVRFPDRSGSILSSKESVASKSSASQESLLKASLSRKLPSGVGLGFVVASQTSGSSVSRFGVRASSSDVASSAEKLAGTDDMSTGLARPKLTADGSGFSSSSSSLARSKHLLTVVTSTSVASSVKVLVPSTGSPSQHPKTPTPPTSPVAKSARPPRITASSASSSSAPSAPSSPRSPSSEKRKLSFAAPFIRAGGALKGVGVDVLKGVSSMSPGSAF